jgi:hypothetical protein
MRNGWGALALAMYGWILVQSGDLNSASHCAVVYYTGLERSRLGISRRYLSYGNTCIRSDYIGMSRAGIGRVFCMGGGIYEG